MNTKVTVIQSNIDLETTERRKAESVCGHFQYHAGMIPDKAKAQIKPTREQCVLILTDLDLYKRESNDFVGTNQEWCLYPEH